MPDERLPTWLSAALLDVANDPRDAELQEDEPTEVLPGDVCVVRSMSGRPSSGRLFVVTDVEDGCCRGMLAGIETELATEVDAVLRTEVDAVLSSSLTGLGYEIAVYTRFFAAVWITQISRRVGAVAGDVLDQLLALAWSDEVEVDLVLERPDGRIVAVEVKATGTPRVEDLKGLRFLADRLGDRFQFGCLLSTAAEATPFGPRLATLPLGQLWKETR